MLVLKSTSMKNKVKNEQNNHRSIRQALFTDYEISINSQYLPPATLLLTLFGFQSEGTAYIHGVKHATGNFIIIMDADLSHHVSGSVSVFV